MALSRADRNLTFPALPSEAHKVSCRMVPRSMPKNITSGVIPEPIEFPVLAHFVPKDLEKLFCPVRVPFRLGMLLQPRIGRHKTKVQNYLFTSIVFPFPPVGHRDHTVDLRVFAGAGAWEGQC